MSRATRAGLRLVAATVATCVALLVGAAPAFAHTRLEGSDPADMAAWTLIGNVLLNLDETMMKR